MTLVMACSFGRAGGTSADGFATRSAPAHAKPDGAVKKGKEKRCEGLAADRNPKCTGERPVSAAATTAARTLAARAPPVVPRWCDAALEGQAPAQ
jgi:hypothetical protein